LQWLVCVSIHYTSSASDVIKHKRSYCIVSCCGIAYITAVYFTNDSKITPNFEGVWYTLDAAFMLEVLLKMLKRNHAWKTFRCKC
jgi:hypothetical protein